MRRRPASDWALVANAQCAVVVVVVVMTGSIHWRRRRERILSAQRRKSVVQCTALQASSAIRLQQEENTTWRPSQQGQYVWTTSLRANLSRHYCRTTGVCCSFIGASISTHAHTHTHTHTHTRDGRVQATLWSSTNSQWRRVCLMGRQWRALNGSVCRGHVKPVRQQGRRLIEEGSNTSSSSSSSLARQTHGWTRVPWCIDRLLRPCTFFSPSDWTCAVVWVYLNGNTQSGQRGVTAPRYTFICTFIT